MVTTTAGKGIVPESHPLSLGSTLSQGATQDYLAEADVVLALGTELAETDMWCNDFAFPGALIRVDIDPGKMNDQHKARVAILGDAAVTARALQDALAARVPAKARDATEARVAALRRELLAGLSPREKVFKRILERLAAGLPEDGMVFTDMTQIAYFGNRFYPAERPGGWFHPVGFGTLGYALPAAIGAKLACPARATVALAGDGGFMFTLQELATAVELNLPVAILLWNNDAYNQILEDMTARGIPEIGVRPKNPDFQALAVAFGCRAARPESLAQLGAALDEALAAAGPTLIELRPDVPDFA